MGLAVGLPIGAAVALGAFLPWTARFIREERIVSAGTKDAVHELLLRIPLATVASEELMFRGALDAIFSQHRSPKSAALLSAALFGAWHIFPALDRTLANPGVSRHHSGSKAKQTLVILGVCGATALGGLALSRLRNRSGSVIAPMLVHLAANAGGFLGGWLATRRPPDDAYPG
jgi:membrane protease YdiL (CAAX protease family)